ncbi:hypothetical protein PMAYCL1PPCAC_05078, partial [Pristionchus mayeri]
FRKMAMATATAFLRISEAAALIVVGANVKSGVAVNVDFEIRNFTTSTISCKGAWPIDGDIASSPLDIAPANQMNFTTTKAEWSTFGSRGVVFFEIAGELFFLHWDVPYMTERNNSLSIGLLGTYKSLGLNVDFVKKISDVFYGGGGRSGYSYYITSSMARALHSFDFAVYYSEVRYVQIQNDNFAIRATMGTKQQCQIKVDIVPIHESDFAIPLGTGPKQMRSIPELLSSEDALACIPSKFNLNLVGRLKNNPLDIHAHFRIDNYTNTTIHYKFDHIWDGNLCKKPIDIDPGTRLQFTTEKVNWSMFGTRGAIVFEIAGKLFLLYWDVPYLSSSRNELTIVLLGQNKIADDNELFSSTMKKALNSLDHARHNKALGDPFTVGLAKLLRAFDYGEYYCNKDGRPLQIEDTQFVILAHLVKPKSSPSAAEIEIEIVPKDASAFAHGKSLVS